jgi:hypothetical protein
MRLVRQQKECGATTLFVAAVVLPMLFFVFSISLDVSRYYTAHEKNQKVLDEAVLYGQRFLPYQKEAKEVTESYLNSHGLDSNVVSVEVDGDKVAAFLNAPLQLTFPRYFGLDANVPMAVYSRSRGSPLDVLIALDASTYLAPSVTGPASAAWGDSSVWPAATFFAQEQRVYEGATALDARIVTQQCFNEPFSALKQSALQSYEYLSAFSKNAVGLAVYPGYGTYVDILRDVHSSDERTVGAGEADFSAYQDLHNSNVLCAAVAEREQSHAGYVFPSANQHIETGASPGAAGSLVLVGPDWMSNQLNANALLALRARESIWSQAAREGTSGDFAELLREARSRVVGSLAFDSRGGLGSISSKVLFVFAGDVPWQGGDRFPDGNSTAAIRAQFNLLKQDVAASNGSMEVKVYYVVFPHDGNASPDFNVRMTEWATFLTQEGLINATAQPGMSVELVQAADADALKRIALGPILLGGRSAVLAR